MIEWLRRADPERPFLRFRGEVWSYGKALADVERRISEVPRLSIPELRPSSIFDLIAGISSGGITVVDRHPQTTDPGDATLVVHTSGTTGTPKGVRLTMENLETAAAASAQHLGHGPDDDWLLAMPLHHVGGISILVRQIYCGGSVTVLPGFDPGPVATAMREGVTMVSVVPTMLRRILDLGPFHGLRAVLVGGGPIPAGLLEEADAVGLPVLPTYGMTETFGQIATLRPGSPLEPKAHPLPGAEFEIRPDGRIAIKSAQVSPGYLGEPDRDGPWFVTNDLGTIDQDGALRVLGRADTVIVTGGENVSAEAVEDLLRTHPDVADVVVVGVPDQDWGQMIVCVYSGDAHDLEAWATERLPGFMVPKRWVRVPSVPQTPLGKPDREAALRLGGEG